MVPVCDKRYHIYNRFYHFWAEIEKLWNYPLETLLTVSLRVSVFVLIERHRYHKQMSNKQKMVSKVSVL